MKKENVFESDVPTLEMETQTLRQTQQGQPIPVVGGIPVNPYTGFTFNPAPAPYAQQNVYGNYNGFPVQTMPMQNVVNPVICNPVCGIFQLCCLYFSGYYSHS